MFRSLIRILGLSEPHPLARGRGSGSGSFHHRAKIVRKPLISTVFCFLNGLLSVKNDVNVPSKSYKQFFVGILKVTDERGRIRIRFSKYGSEDPDADPYQTVPDPEHWFLYFLSCLLFIMSSLCVDMFDKDQTGQINLNEFGALFDYINRWKERE